MAIAAGMLALAQCSRDGLLDSPRDPVWTILPSMDLTQTISRILAAQLGPAYPAESFGADTALLGRIPELDSMAVVGILAAIEDETGISIPDDEVSADAFATFSALESFVRQQMPSDG